jgi:protein phosphatase
VIGSEGKVILEAFGCTDAGHVRVANEDFFLMGDLDRGELGQRDEIFRVDTVRRGPLFVVCDGLGGAAAGEVASKLAAEVIWEEMREAQGTVKKVVYARLLRRAVRVANRRVWDAGKEDPRLRGMGTTVSAAGLVGDALVLAQVGDSRAYVMRGDSLVQVTRDQSVVSALVRSGRLTEHEARILPESNMILQALGVRQDIEVALSVVELRRGDRVLLCTDGLHGPVADQAIRRLLSTKPDPRSAAEVLVESACMAGGPDNVTAVVVDLEGEGLHPPQGEGDLPHFVELDHREEGARALASTSVVARRLAARVGLVEDPGPPVVPATGQHAAMRASDPGIKTRQASQPGDPGPAVAALAEGSRLSAPVWIVTIVVALVVGALLSLVLF